MATPFAVLTEKTPNLLHRLLRKEPKENAIVAINNLLAHASHPSEVAEPAVQEVAERYTVNLQRSFSSELQELYAQFLRHCLEDQSLSEREVTELAHLKQILGLTDSQVGEIHANIVGAVYSASVDEVVADGRLSEEERDFLTKLESELRLPSELAGRIATEHVQARLNAHVNAAVADQRLSPEEEAEIHAIARSFGASLNFDEETRELLDRFRLYWVIENGELPEISTDIRLQRGEACYAIRDVDWYELRTVTKRVNYGGPTARIRIAKGLYYRVGSVSVQRVSEDVMKQIDSGRVYLTNKRLIFQGGQRNTTIALKKILGFNPFSNGVEIQKESGKSPFLQFTDSVDVFALLLDRVLRDSD